MNNTFYYQFENRYRGSRELIKSRLKVYLPFVTPVFNVLRSATAVDLGCGRGEWLELVGELGAKALGVDIDHNMLEECAEINLNAVNADAVTYLRDVESESLCVVSAFHLVEHISFQDLKDLISEAERVLKPGGLLILETPNPDNLVVGSHLFYSDPTHIAPIPNTLLSFTVEFAGFKTVKAIFLQEDPEIHSKEPLSLLDVLAGVSPDYAIVAQKEGSEELSAALEKLFSQSYGVRLDELAKRYSDGLEQKLQGYEELSLRAESQLELVESQLTQYSDYPQIKESLVARIDMMESQMSQHDIRLGIEEVSLQKAQDLLVSGQRDLRMDLEAMVKVNLDSMSEKISSTENSAEKLQAIAMQSQERVVDLLVSSQRNQRAELEAMVKAELDSMSQKLTSTINLAEQWQATAMQSERRMADLLASVSWKATWPLRMLLVINRAPVRFFIWLIKLPLRVVKGSLNAAITFTLSRPKLTSSIIAILDNFPSLKRLIISLTFYVRRASLSGPEQTSVPAVVELEPEVRKGLAADGERLEPPKRPRGMNHEAKSPLEKWGP
jgi:SAM-dependent methyltransferase